MPRCRASPRQKSLCLDGPETSLEKFFLSLGVVTVTLLLFLRLILESVTLLFGLSMEDN